MGFNLKIFYILLIFLFSCDNDDNNDYVNSDFTVNVGSYYYNPQHLEIELGQSVRWINSSGFHDVEITSGPISFYLDACSGSCVIGAYTFNQLGTYNYICSIGNHAQQGMIGSITVVENIDY